MKHLMLIFLILFSQVCFTQEAYLKDGEITVALKNGKTYTYSTNEYMVVKRHTVAKPKPLAEAPAAAKIVIVEAPKKKELNSRVIFHGGVGSDYEAVRMSQHHVQVREKTDFVFGASLGTKVKDNMSLTGTALSNRTYLLGVGFDY